MASWTVASMAGQTTNTAANAMTAPIAQMSPVEPSFVSV
jgi:hypothetical protein